MIIYWIGKLIFTIFARLFFRLKVEGLENLPRKGGYILAANHASSLDPFIIMAAIPRYICWGVIYEYYDLWYLRWFLRQMRFFRLQNNLPKQAFTALKQGQVIGAFPEGRRSWTGKLGPGRPGVAFMAERTSCPVVPVAVKGTFAALPRTRKLVRFQPVTIRVGRPLYFSKPEQSTDRPKLEKENTRRIMSAIAGLLER